MREINISKRGGKRDGSGRKPEYGEPTVNLTVRVPASKKAILLAIIRRHLMGWKRVNK